MCSDTASLQNCCAKLNDQKQTGVDACPTFTCDGQSDTAAGTDRSRRYPQNANRARKSRRENCTAAYSGRERLAEEETAAVPHRPSCAKRADPSFQNKLRKRPALGRQDSNPPAPI